MDETTNLEERQSVTSKEVIEFFLGLAADHGMDETQCNFYRADERILLREVDLQRTTGVRAERGHNAWHELVSQGDMLRTWPHKGNSHVDGYRCVPIEHILVGYVIYVIDGDGALHEFQRVSDTSWTHSRTCTSLPSAFNVASVVGAHARVDH